MSSISSPTNAIRCNCRQTPALGWGRKGFKSHAKPTQCTQGIAKEKKTNKAEYLLISLSAILARV